MGEMLLMKLDILNWNVPEVGLMKHSNYIARWAAGKIDALILKLKWEVCVFLVSNEQQPNVWCVTIGGKEKTQGFQTNPPLVTTAIILGGRGFGTRPVAAARFPAGWLR